MFVRLAGGRFFTVPEEHAAGLSIGAVLSDEEIGRLGRVDQYVRGRDKAMRMIAARARTRAEVEKKLASMEIDAPIAGGIMRELEELGLVDDERFAREYVRAKADIKRLGPHRLRFDLKKRGVKRAHAEEALSEGFAREDQEAMAWDLVARKVGSGPVDEKVARRIAGMLRRKGYDYEVVNHVTYELLRRGGVDSD